MKKTNELTEMAVSIALAFLCGFIRLYQMPQGGSVSLTMIPLLLISFRLGPVKGMLSGAVYGLISLAVDGVIYHPMSILLDYVLAFGMMGVAGFFKKNLAGITLGSICATFARFVSSLVSGAVIFKSYAPAGQNPWIYSAVYQATYLVPELVIAIAVLLLLYLKANRLFGKASR